MSYSKKELKKLKKLNERLKKISKARTDFLAVASHQLKTPLASIKGFTMLLIEGMYGQINKNQKDTLEKIYVSNEKLIKLVEDLLNTSRIEDGQMYYDFAVMDLRILVERTVDNMQLNAQKKGLILFFNDRTRKQTKTEIYGDFRKLAEVIGNLIDNALKYTKKGRVEVSLRKHGCKLRIEVIDTGIGFHPQDSQIIFKKYNRSSNPGRLTEEGTGLGLYIIKKITEAHKGKIWAQSLGKNRGSIFILEFSPVSHFQ